LKSEQSNKCESDFEKTQKSRPIKRANDLSSSSSDEFYSAISTRDSLDELESLISVNMKKRHAERQFINHVSETSSMVTDEIITDGISLALEEIDMRQLQRDIAQELETRAYPTEDNSSGS